VTTAPRDADEAFAERFVVEDLEAESLEDL